MISKGKIFCFVFVACLLLLLSLMLQYEAINQKSSHCSLTTDFLCWLWRSLHFWKRSYGNNLIALSSLLPAATLCFGERELSTPILTYNTTVCGSGWHNIICLQKVSLTSKYHLCIIPKYVLPDILCYKTTEEKWIKLRIKVKRENNNGLCCCPGGTACQVSFAETHIPQPVIINGLTSTGKKKKKTVWKLRTKEIPADKVKTN